MYVYGRGSLLCGTAKILDTGQGRQHMTKARPILYSAYFLLSYLFLYFPAKLHTDTPSDVDACSTVQCEPWEVCGIVGNQGKCYCTKPLDCPPAESTEEMVCGSDKKEYDTYCHMKATACFFRRTITVYTNGTCPEESSGNLSEAEVGFFFFFHFLGSKPNFPQLKGHDLIQNLLYN